MSLVCGKSNLTSPHTFKLENKLHLLQNSLELRLVIFQFSNQKTSMGQTQKEFWSARHKRPLLCMKKMLSKVPPSWKSRHFRILFPCFLSSWRLIHVEDVSCKKRFEGALDLFLCCPHSMIHFFIHPWPSMRSIVAEILNLPNSRNVIQVMFSLRLWTLYLCKTIPNTICLRLMI